MNTPLVRDYLDLASDATVDQFIVKPDTDAAELARQYTLTSAIRPRLDALLGEIKNALARDADIGRFIFGSFGSGKSHFLRIAGMMLACDARLYENTRDAGVQELRRLHAWLEDAKLLVVEASMIGVGPVPNAFTRFLAQKFDERLEQLGLPPLRAFGTSAAFEQFEANCERISEYFSAFEKATGYDRAFYDTMRARPANDPDAISFARELAQFVAGDAARFDPSEAEAREQMARHAKQLGFRGVVFVIDEFVLWAQSLSGEQYAAAINALNALVESADVRPLRFVVLAAIQRSISTVFPDDRTDTMLREQLRRVKDRFPELHLEDNNLFEIAERRVLAPLAERAEAWKNEVRRVSADLADGARGVLIGDQPASALEQLYPFHPALLRVLSDITQGLQRERSSLYMLYLLLTKIRPELRMGQLVSLGALWEVLFAKEQVDQLEAYTFTSDPTHHVNKLLKTYRTWQNLREPIARVSGGEANEKVLGVIIKSALLAQLSHVPFLDAFRGLDKAVTVENLFRLNKYDIDVPIETIGVKRVFDLVSKLAQLMPGVVTLEGQGPGAFVRIELNAVDITGLMEALRADPSTRFGVLLAAAREVLGFGSAFRGQDGTLSITSWRSVTRTARIRFESFDQFSTSGKNNTLALETGDAVKLGILLEPEFGGSAREAARNVVSQLESTREQAQMWAAVWIPGPLSADGREALEMLAKHEMFRKAPDTYLANYKLSEHPIIRQRIEGMANQARTSLRAALARAYGDDARVLTLRKEPPELFIANVDIGQRAKKYVEQLLDRRYPQHPRFAATPTPSGLNRLLDIHARVLADSSKNVLERDDADVVERLGLPLELFDPGVGVVNLRAIGMYLDKIKELIAKGERRVRAIVERLGEEPFGLERSVAQLLTAALAQREGYRLIVDDAPIVLKTLSDVDLKASLVKGNLPSAADWNGARRAAALLFGVTDVPSAHTIASVDAFTQAVRDPLRVKTELLERCKNALAQLKQQGAYAGESAAQARYEALWRDFLALRDEARLVERLAALDAQAYVPLVQAAASDAPALEQLVRFEHLRSAAEGVPELGASLRDLLEQGAPPLASESERWRTRAKEWIDTLLRERIAARKPQASPQAPAAKPMPPAPVVADVDIVRKLVFPRADGGASGLGNDFQEKIFALASDALREAAGSAEEIEVTVRVLRKRVVPTP